MYLLGFYLPVFHKLQTISTILSYDWVIFTRFIFKFILQLDLICFGGSQFNFYDKILFNILLVLFFSSWIYTLLFNNNYFLLEFVIQIVSYLSELFCAVYQQSLISQNFFEIIIVNFFHISLPQVWIAINDFSLDNPIKMTNTQRVGYFLMEKNGKPLEFAIHTHCMCIWYGGIKLTPCTLCFFLTYFISTCPQCKSSQPHRGHFCK